MISYWTRSSIRILIAPTASIVSLKSLGAMVWLTESSEDTDDGIRNPLGFFLLLFGNREGNGEEGDGPVNIETKLHLLVLFLGSILRNKLDILVNIVGIRGLVVSQVQKALLDKRIGGGRDVSEVVNNISEKNGAETSSAPLQQLGTRCTRVVEGETPWPFTNADLLHYSGTSHAGQVGSRVR